MAEDKKKVFKKGNILFFDPNNTTIDDTADNNLKAIFGGDEIMKTPEDLSISIDLEVINKSRNNITLNDKTSSEDVVKISSITSGKKVNFLSGKKLGGINVLSTYFTDIKYNETDENTLSEALSIKSIDIEFNSWYVATVNINFVDVRGAALFSPSEHNSMDTADYIKDSPYSAFFTMPYPQFNLKVKGVYGDAVSYPLHLLDFKSTFNNSTGNFEINTSFIGYTYAILNDIQMTYIIASPYLDYHGKAYWDGEVERGRFKTLEGKELPKIPELIERVVRGDHTLQKMAASDSTIISNNITQLKVNDIDKLLNELYNYVNIVRQVFGASSGSDYNIKLTTNTNEEDILGGEEVSKLKNDIIILVKKFNDNYPDDALFTSTYYIGSEKGSGQVDLVNELTPKGGELNVTNFHNILSNFKKTEAENLIDLNEEVNNTILTNLIDVYDFRPSIYNFTKILLAHMETLLHVIGQTAKDSINDNGREPLGDDNNHETDLKGGKLDPFPWLTVNNEDAWFGDYSQYANFSEVKLVNSFHKAKTESTSIIDKVLTEVIIDDTNDLDPSTKTSIGDIWLPINAFDNSINLISGKNEAPYSNIKGVFDYREIESVLSSRIITIAALASRKNPNSLVIEAESYGLAESINILKQIGYSEKLVGQYKTVLEGIINRIGIVLESGGTDKEYFTNPKSTHQMYFYKEGFNFLDVKGQLPLNTRTASDLGGFIDVDGKFNSEVAYYEKNSIDNVKIIEGRNNCQSIYDNWYLRVKHLASEESRLTEFMYNYYLEDDNLALGYSGEEMKELPKIQPMLNRVGRITDKSRDFFASVNKNVIKDINKEINNDNNNFVNYFYKNNTDDAYAFDLNIRYHIKDKGISGNNELTYPLVGGVIKSRLKNKKDVVFSLFGDSMYYRQGDNVVGNVHDARGEAITANRAKAYLFLQTLPIDTNNIVSYINSGISFMLKAPKALLLFLGSVQWRLKYYNDRAEMYLKDPILRGDTMYGRPGPHHAFRVKSVFTLNDTVNNYDSYNIPLESSISKNLIEYFTNWCSSDNGWGDIRDILELKDKKGGFIENSVQFELYLKEFEVGKVKNYKNYLCQLIDEVFTVKLSATGSFNVNRKTLNIIYKDGSEPVKTILNFLSEEVIIAHTGEYKIFSQKEDEFASKEGSDLNALLEITRTLASKILTQLTIHEIYDTSLKNKDSIGQSTFDQNREINLQTYKYLKSLYDKWVSGYEYNSNNSEYKWISSEMSTVDGIETYDIKNFKFIDRSYNHIGQKFILNLKDVLSNIGLNEERTLYTTITNILSKNNFLFIPMPNYQPWNEVYDFAKVFEPIPHHLSKINVGNDKYNAQFLCMYTGELSKRLDNNNRNNEFKNDGLDLNIAKNITIPSDYNPKELNDSQSKLLEGALESVPVFAVSYGRQNQQYFKNITLNQNNPATTEASVMAIQRLVERNDKATSIELVTQDLYNIYSDYSYLCEIEMLGCAQIQPMMYFQLTNIPMWNGAYLIYKVKHNIQPGAMTTSFTGMKMGKRYPDFITPKTITYGDLSNTYGGIEHNYVNINLDEKIGEFYLRDYFKGSSNTYPGYAVQRIKSYSAPVIDKIYKTWVNGKKETPFVITSGYRTRSENSASMHDHGLAVDIQISGKNKDGNIHNELFEHIKWLMKNDVNFKLDQLILESEDKDDKTISYWIHVGVAKIQGNMISRRGLTATMKNHINYAEGVTIKEAIGEPTSALPTSNSGKLLDEYVAFWKEAENSKESNKGGWNNKDRKWYMYDDVGEPAIAYGLRIKDGFEGMNPERKNALIKGDEGITDDEAIDEVNYRIVKVMDANNEYMTKLYPKEKWELVDDRYKYILVDIYLNTGGIAKFPKLRDAIIASTEVNNKDTIKNECRTKITINDKLVFDDRRNKLRAQFIDRNYT